MNERKEYPRGTGITKLSEISLYLADFRLGLERVEMFTEKLSKFVENEDKLAIAQTLSRMDDLYWKYFRKFIERVKRSDG